MTEILRLNKNNIFFVFIDLQSRLLRDITNGRQLLARNKLVLAAANALGIPYLVTRQYRSGLGDLDPDFEKDIQTTILDKTAFSCVADPAFWEAVQKISRNCVVLAGLETHICVLQTMLDFITRDYEVMVVADAVAARGFTDHAVGLTRMERSGAMLVTSEMLIYELLQTGDSPAFKQILPLIKAADAR